MRLKKAPFVAWIYEHHKEPHTRMIDALKVPGCIERRASVSIGIENAVQSRDAVIDVSLDDPLLNDVLDRSLVDATAATTSV